MALNYSYVVLTIYFIDIHPENFLSFFTYSLARSLYGLCCAFTDSVANTGFCVFF